MSLAELRDVVGSSDESGAPSPRRSRSLESGRGRGKGQFNDDEGDAVMGHDQDDRTGRGVGTSIDPTQEASDCGILRVAPEKKAWLPPQRVLNRLSNTVSDRYRIRLFYSSRLYDLESSASKFRTEHDFYIDVFFKPRWYSRNHKRDGALHIQARNAFIHNVGEIGLEAWLGKLTLSMLEKRTSIGARYKQHLLSREAGLPCLSWGDKCQCCVNNMSRAPKDHIL